jgi:hypothetical protein
VVLYLERRKVFARIGINGSPVAGALLTGALAIYGLLAVNVVRPPAQYMLSIEVVIILSVWAAVFALCRGTPARKAARLPFLPLAMPVPLPSA